MKSPLLPFPQLLFPRLKRALQRLALSVWKDPVSLTVARTAAHQGDFSYDQATRSRLKPVRIPSSWQAPGFSTSWFRLQLPDGYSLRPGDHLHWDDNAEATAWLHGEPLFGLDATHRYWPWPRKTRELWLESIFCQSGIWHAAAKGIGPLGSVLTRACLVQKNETNWQAYFDLEVITDWLEEEVRRTFPAEAEQLTGGFRSWPEMDSASSSFLPDGVGTGLANRFRPELDRMPALLRKVFAELDEAVTIFHTEGAAALRKRLQPIYTLLRESADPVHATLTGHAHIDLVWLWPERTGEQKAVRTFATAETLLKTYPDFVFGYSQPASYEAIGRRAPGLMQRVNRQIRAGRWETAGAMYVESDSLMACGEALLRSLTLGQEGFQALQGTPSKILWLPDAFGFSSCLPALMQMAGVQAFYTNKLMWNMIHRFPHSSFVWRGADGSEVLAHVSRACGYNHPARPRNLRIELEAHSQSSIHPEMLLPSGWGDGGGGPTADIIERVKRQANLRNQPSTSWGRIDAFYDRMEAVRDKLPVHVGEILLEAHRGTYTTHGYMKHAYRKLERALQTREAVQCATGGDPIDNHPWKRLVFAQFHDFLPGSSIHEVYEELVPELDRLADQALDQSCKILCGGTGTAEGWFNPLPLPLRVSTREGDVVMAPLSSETKMESDTVKADPENYTLHSDRIEARFDAKGALTQLTVDGKPVISAPPQLISYSDIPYDLEAWEIDRQALDCGAPLLPGTSAIKFSKNSVTSTWQTRKGSSVSCKWQLRAGSPVLELLLEVDWKEAETLLRFEMPTPFNGSHALFAAPFGGSWRPQHSGNSRCSALWESPANRYVMSANEGRSEGAFLLTEAKYGFSAQDGRIGVSILKSAKVTVTTAFPAAFRAPGPERAPFSDLGKHEVRLALGHWSASCAREDHPAALAETTFATPLRCNHSLPTLFPTIEGLPSVIPAWAAPLDSGGWLLRLHETIGNHGTIRISPPKGWKIRSISEAFPTTRGRFGKGPLDQEVSPFGIITLELRQ